jgi:NACHT domain
MWLAGSGKSVLWYVSLILFFLGVLTFSLSSSIVEDIRAICQIGLANLVFFYFDFRDIEKQDARSLLSSLLMQLCRESDQFSQILPPLYSVHGNGSRLPSEDTLMECLKNILKLPEQGEIYIVLDALDECPNVSGFPTPRKQVLTIIEEIINLRLPHVHFCITSRLEVDIRYVLQALAVREVPLHEQAGQNQYIFDYIEYVVSSDLRMRRWRERDRRLVVKTLTEKGGGM